MWSCFEDLVIKKIMVQSKFDFNTQFDRYHFSSFKFVVRIGMTSSFFLHACIYKIYLLLLLAKMRV